MAEDWIGKNIRLLFQDTNAVLSKVGIVKSYDAVFITIETRQGTEIIPLVRVIRIEVIK